MHTHAHDYTTPYVLALFAESALPNVNFNITIMNMLMDDS